MEHHLGRVQGRYPENMRCFATVMYGIGESTDMLVASVLKIDEQSLLAIRRLINSM